MNVHSSNHAQVQIGFRQNNTSSTRSCTQNSGPTYELSDSPPTTNDNRRTFVTNRRKLFDMTGRLSASLWVLSSLGLPGPPLPPADVAAGSLGKFGGNSDESRRSDTLVDIPAVGTVNLREVLLDEDEAEAGGKDAPGLLGRGVVIVPEAGGGSMGWAAGGMGT
jgi:hypothetical protein